MASIVERKKRFYVVYMYNDEKGARKQKWESFTTYADARRRKAEVEYREQMGSLVIPQCHTMHDLLQEYVSMYGKNKWALSTYQANISLIEHYIEPFIGDMKITAVNSRVLEKFYQKLLKTKAVPKCTDRKHEAKMEFVTPNTIRNVNKLLRSCFNQAMRWNLIEKNPAIHATLPKGEHEKREIWTAETLFYAIEICEDPRLKLAMNLAFSCSLRKGELLGLTWDCVNITPESIEKEEAYIYINKELQRVSRSVLDTLEKKDVIAVFPVVSERNRTQLVLKKPKTRTSIRKVFLPRSVAEMLVSWKNEQDAVREALGSEYQDYDLVIAGPFGAPTEGSAITLAFQRLIKEHDLPKVVFHSLRHSSITYKLKLNGGDIKAVQGDSGHAQAKMVTDQYSHILDDDRKVNAQLFEKAFYQRQTLPQKTSDHQAEEISEDQAALFAKLMKDPEAAALLQALVAKIK